MDGKHNQKRRERRALLFLTGFTPSEIKRRRRLTVARGNLSLTGFTLIELMLVVVIIGVLASMVMPKLVGKSEQAKKSVAQADIEASISSALELYEIDNGKFPESLSVLVGKYLKKDPKDPWSNSYNYKSPGDHNQDSYDLYSKGRDGMEGTEDDITNWK
ncbi:MAG TPA: type II secretion system protein GspG [Candidatus Omnitrophica bacterium]|nr:type II secretion system protein GspG [Candidatus Omnitrophota bacterium]HBU08039.1 type II secretion system protein GspG [Candidatus Omnitrophota bacterium]